MHQIYTCLYTYDTSPVSAAVQCTNWAKSRLMGPEQADRLFSSVSADTKLRNQNDYDSHAQTAGIRHKPNAALRS